MIINSDKKYVFVCVPKTATTSLHKFLVTADNMSVKKVKKEWGGDKWHWSMSSIINEYTKLNFNEYYKFAFHRNPWDRLVSSLIEFTSEKGHIATWSKELCNYKSFEEFILDLPNSQWKDEIHFQPTTYYTHSNGKKIVDFIGRYENLQTDLQKVFKKINHNIDNFNTGQKHRRTTRDKDYKKYYISDKMINIVGDLFHKDILTFGDKFND